MTRGIVRLDLAALRALVGLSDSARRVGELERSRAAVVDDAAGTLRRIERDLHDGTQARLVSLAMNVGLAREKLAEGGDPAQAQQLLDTAHRTAKEAIAEVRDLARGIHPAVLDTGLDAALATLAAHSAVPVTVQADLRRRPDRAIETIAYFCAAELLTNAAKHSGARIGDRARRRPRLAARARRARRRAGRRGDRRRDGPGRARRAGPRGRRFAHRRQSARRPDRGHRRPADGADAMRVVIAEDSAILRDGLATLLTDRGHTVVAAVADADALRAAVAADPPDVCVVDIRMPPTFTDEGVRAALALRHSHPDVGVLVFSQYVETRYAAELLAGAPRGVGYLLKDRVADVREFVDALERVGSGGTALDPEVVSQLLGASRRRDAVDRLTAREREVLARMAEGLSNAGIAAALVVSDGAVEKHIANIFLKLGLPPSETDNRRVLAVLRYLED